MDEVLTLQEACRFLKKGEPYMRKHAKEHGGKKFGGEWRFLKSKMIESFSEPEAEIPVQPFDEVRLTRVS